LIRGAEVIVRLDVAAILDLHGGAVGDARTRHRVLHLERDAVNVDLAARDARWSGVRACCRREQRDAHPDNRGASGWRRPPSDDVGLHAAYLHALNSCFVTDMYLQDPATTTERHNGPMTFSFPIRGNAFWMLVPARNGEGGQ